MGLAATIPVMEVVLHELVISLQLARVRVQRDDAAGVEIVALAIVADEVRPRVADRRVKQPGVSIERVGRVRAAARFDPVGVVRPGLGSITRGGDGVEAPQAIAVLRVEGPDMADAAVVAARISEVHAPVPNLGAAV